MKRRNAAILFHSVGLDRWPWSSSHISEPLGSFSDNLACLAESGLATYFFGDAPEAVTNGPVRVALTFDDGYLDNWVHAFPILERFGFKATIFVSTDFVDPRPICRPQQDPDSMCAESHNPGECCAGFLSWPEMRSLEASGLVRIESHAKTHTWVFKGPRIIDFWHPGAATQPHTYPWMVWNRFPERKPFYLTEAEAMEDQIPYGTPIYENGVALSTRCFQPEEDLAGPLSEYVDSHGGREFFEHPNWRDLLHGEVRRWRERHGGAKPLGQYETERDYIARVRRELHESKALLEEQLEKRVRVLCWPVGGVNEICVEIARDEGYEHFTLPGVFRVSREPFTATDATLRIGCGTHPRWRGRALAPDSPRDFVSRVYSNTGSAQHYLRLRLSLLRRVLIAVLRKGG